jgi:hypothetical protein
MVLSKHIQSKARIKNTCSYYIPLGGICNLETKFTTHPKFVLPSHVYYHCAIATFREDVRGHGGKSPRYLNIEEAVTNRT